MAVAMFMQINRAGLPMHDVVRGIFWLAVVCLVWSLFIMRLVVVFVLSWAAAWINRKFDVCFGDW